MEKSADKSLIDESLIITFKGQREWVGTRSARPAGAFAADCMESRADEGNMEAVVMLRRGAEQLIESARQREPWRPPELVVAGWTGRDNECVELVTKLAVYVRAYERGDPRVTRSLSAEECAVLDRMSADAEEVRALLVRDVHPVAIRRDGEIGFIASPLGTLVVSAIMGIARGSLRFCRGCERPFTGDDGWAQYRRQWCNTCRGTSLSTRLDSTKQEIWRRVSGRMQNRFRRSNQADGYRAWRPSAWSTLLQAGDLQAWEAEYASLVPRGRRPRSA